MMCGFDAECVAIVANCGKRAFFLAFFPDSCHNSHALASKPHTIFYSVHRHTDTLPYTSLAHAHRGINIVTIRCIAQLLSFNGSLATSKF